MKIVVRHGHFAFYPAKRQDVFHFQRIFKIPLFPEEDYYTFLGLTHLPRWSQVGRLFGTLPALLTYEAEHAWEVMAENDFVYSLALGVLVPTTAIKQTTTLKRSLDYVLAPGILIQPGASLTDTGNVVLGYQGFIDLDVQRLYLSSVDTLL